eukprot:6190841-Ditylum_brightwellii.AAC.1
MMLHGIDDGVDGGEIHLTHFTRKIDCCLVQKMKQNARGECQDHGVLSVNKNRILLSESAKLNDGKEVDDYVDDHVNDGVDD